MERLTDNTNYCSSWSDCEMAEGKCVFYGNCYDRKIYNKLREYEDLEEQGLLLKLPCKVGDKVYILDDIVDIDKCKNCDFYYWGGMGDYPACNKTKRGFRAVDCIELKEEAISFKNILYCLGNDVFGKNVFLTKAEAEKALEEMEK